MKHLQHTGLVVLLTAYVTVAFTAQMMALTVPATSFSSQQMQELGSTPPMPSGHRIELKRHVPALKVVIDLAGAERDQEFPEFNPDFHRLPFHPEPYLLTKHTASLPKRGPPFR